MKVAIISSQVKEFFRKEKFEPDILRAFIITIALIVPLAVAYCFHQPLLGIIPGITAQLMSSSRIQGTYTEKALILVIATLAIAVASFVGTLAGSNLIAAVIFMGVVAGIASLARSIGDYGQGFGISAVILFLISLQGPNTISNAFHHAYLVILGGSWAILLSLYKWPFHPNGPFYLDIAMPWYKSSSIMKYIVVSFDEFYLKSKFAKKEIGDLNNKNTRYFQKWRNTSMKFSNEKKNEALISALETDLRKAINNVLPWLKKKRKETESVRRETLKIVRASSRFGVTALALHNELESLSDKDVQLTVLLKIKRTAEVIGVAGEQMTNAILERSNASYLKTNKSVERSIKALNGFIRSLEIENPETEVWVKLLHIVALFESSIHYLQDSLLMIKRIKDKKNERSTKNAFDLDLYFKRLWYAIRLQIQPDSLLLKHCLRVMLTTSIGILGYYLMDIPRGYWIVLTIMILLQPEFSTTWEKARDRILGTLLGVVLGTFILISSYSFHFVFLISIITVCVFLFIYFQAKNYKVAVVFVTIQLVAMLDVAEHIDWHVAAYRLLATIIGGIMSIAAAYFLWPEWESFQFPKRMGKAIQANKNYLLQIGHELRSKSGFHPRVIADRRKAEIENINLDESLKRLRLEPSGLKKKLKYDNDLVNINKKLTREITTFSAFLPDLKDNIDFIEAEELINYTAGILDQLSKGIEKEEVIQIKPEFGSRLSDMEGKIQKLERLVFKRKEEEVLIIDTSLPPYELICAEIKKIISHVNTMLEIVSKAES